MVFKQFNTDTFLSYRVNELSIATVVIYVDGTLEVANKPSLIDTIECIKKYCVNGSTSEIEYYLGCTIKNHLTKMTFNIDQPHIITKMMQVFNKDMK